MLRALLVLAALLIAVPVDAAPRSRLRTRPGAASAPVYSDTQFAKSGEGFTAAGMPSPTVDCRFTASGPSCSGATLSVTGSPTYVDSPWYPSGFSSAPLKSAVLGSLDSFASSTPIPASTSAFTACIDWTSSAANQLPISRNSAGSGWYINRASATVYLTINTAGGGGDQGIAVGSATADYAETIACFSYKFVTSGTSEVRMIANGSPVSSKTNATGPLNDLSALPIVIGPTGNRLNGTVSALAYWDGVAASSVQLQELYSSFVGLKLAKPAGSYATSTRAGVKTCTPTSTSKRFLYGNNIPCIEERGLRAESVRKNEIAVNLPDAINSWTDGGAAVTANQCVARDGATTMDLLDNTAATNISERNTAGSVSSTTGPFAASADISTGGNGIKTVSVKCASGNMSTCACVVQDGATTCTGTASGAYCHAKATVGTGTVRLTAIGTCASAQTAPLMVLTPGEYGVSTGSACFGAAQLEVLSGAIGVVPSSYYPTGAGTRAVDIVSASSAIPAGVPHTMRIVAQTSRFPSTENFDLGLAALTFVTGGAEYAAIYGLDKKAMASSVDYNPPTSSGVSRYDYGATGATGLIPWGDTTVSYAFNPVIGSVPRYWENRVEFPFALTLNPGTRIITTAGDKIYFGAEDGGGSRMFGGWLKSVRIHKGIKP